MLLLLGVFLHFFCDIELVHIFSTSSSKSDPNASVFNIFKWKSSSRSLVHFLSTTFPDRAAKPRKQRPPFGDHGSHFTRKKHSVSRPKVFSTCDFTRIWHDAVWCLVMWWCDGMVMWCAPTPTPSPSSTPTVTTTTAASLLLLLLLLLPDRGPRFHSQPWNQRPDRAHN